MAAVTSNTADPTLSTTTISLADSRSAGEIVVVESVGSAVFDVAAATAIYEAAREAGLGTDLAL